MSLAGATSGSPSLSPKIAAAVQTVAAQKAFNYWAARPTSKMVLSALSTAVQEKKLGIGGTAQGKTAWPLLYAANSVTWGNRVPAVTSATNTVWAGLTQGAASNLQAQTNLTGGYDVGYQAGAAQSSGTDWLSMLPMIIIAVLLMAGLGVLRK